MNYFLSTIEDVLIQINKQNREHLKQFHKYKELTQSKDSEIERLKLYLKKETDKGYDMEGSISDLLTKIEAITSESKTNADIQLGLKHELDELNKDFETIEKERTLLLQKVKRFKIYLFKVVSFVVALFIFVLFMLFVNQ